MNVEVGPIGRHTPLRATLPSKSTHRGADSLPQNVHRPPHTGATKANSACVTNPDNTDNHKKGPDHLVGAFFVNSAKNQSH